ncbi:MAG: site-specific DNA-methyltransferase [Clostridiales bacterium]|jgi:DNA modification methylase|nr:site-specific DNA-methyltransferase [Clostridiales bacterium]
MQVYNKNNINIHNCDNIDLLESLPDDSVNLIYSDILYNTGKKFTDYNDNLGSPNEAVEWYRPRIQEMKRVLSPNGSIYIHCNWRLDSYMRILMDDVFGGDCFRNRIYRKHSNERGFYSNFDSQIDSILYYVKNPRNFVFNEQISTETQTVALFEDGIFDGRSDQRMGIDLGAPNKHWLVNHQQLKAMQDKGEVQIINGLPYRVSNVKAQGNLWDEPEMLDAYSRTIAGGSYDTPKPDSVLERIISTSSNEGDIVADFFLGGGTTAVIAKNLNRKFIGCDINPKACEVTINKLEGRTPLQALRAGNLKPSEVANNQSENIIAKKGI